MARYHIGVIYKRMGDLDAAAREFQRAIDDGLEEVSGLYHLADIHESKGDEATAKELLKRAREFSREK